MTELILTPLRALLFDVDGTLCESAALHHQAWAHVAGQLGVPVPSWQDYVAHCLRGQHRFEDLLDLRRTDAAVQSTLHELKSRAFRQMALDSLAPLAGVEGLWARVRALNIHLAVVSTARRRSVEDTLDILRLPYPDLVITREDVVHVKPDPAGYRLAAEKLRLDPKDCVAFEDSPAGIQAAVAAGIPCLAMSSPIFASKEQSGALLLLSSLEDVELISQGEGLAKLLARGAVLT